MKYKYSGKITLKDYIICSTKNMFNKWVIILLLLVLALIILQIIITEDGITTVLYNNLYILAFPGFYIFGLYYQIRYYKSEKGFIDDIKYELSDSEIIISTSYGKTNLQWKNIYKVKEIKGYILLYNNRYNYFMLPERFIKNYEDLGKIKKVILNNIDNKKIKMKK